MQEINNTTMDILDAPKMEEQLQRENGQASGNQTSQDEKEVSIFDFIKMTAAELQEHLGLSAYFEECLDDNPEDGRYNLVLVDKYDHIKKYKPSQTENIAKEFLNNGHKMSGVAVKELINKLTQDFPAYTDGHFHNDIGWGEYQGEVIFKYDKVATAKGILPSHYNGTLPIESKGTKEAYLQGIRELVVPYPKLMITYGAGFTGIITSQLNEEDSNIMIALCGKRGRGKSTSTNLMFSGWGKPQAFLMSYNTTDNKWEDVAAKRKILLISIDDILVEEANTSNTNRLKLINKTIFRASTGKTKDRYYRDSQIYHGAMVVSAEASLFGTQTDAQNEGQLYRMIELEVGDNDLTQDATHAKKIERLIKRNYGHMIFEFGAYMLANGFIGDTLDGLYELEYDGLLMDKRIKDNERLANRLSVVMLTLKLLNNCFDLGANLLEIKEVLITSAIAPFNVRSGSDLAYERLWETVQNNKAHFADSSKTFKTSTHMGVIQSDGYEGVEVIIPGDRFVPLFYGNIPVNIILTHCTNGGGYSAKNKDVEQILKIWRRNQLLENCESSNRLQKKLNMGGKVDTSVYVVKYPERKLG